MKTTDMVRDFLTQVLPDAERRSRWIGFVAVNAGLKDPRAAPDLVERIAAARLDGGCHE